MNTNPNPTVRAMLQVSTCADGAQAPDSPALPVLDFTASNGALDRYHEIIDPAGWRLESYRRNPVFQNAHNYGDIIFTLGKALVTEVRKDAAGAAQLFQRIQFATDVNPMARIAHGLYKGGFLNAVSVGFVPIRWENGGEDSGFRRKYVEQELLEVSAVAIPANPEALALGLKAGAVQQSDLRDLLELLRATVPSGKAGQANPLLNFARELRAIMRA